MTRPERDPFGEGRPVPMVLSLFAPGSAINSSVPGGGFAVFSGTSMAAPHVAGAFQAGFVSSGEFRGKMPQLCGS